MFKKIALLTVVQSLLCSATLEAAVINADWKAAGDGLAILDTASNMEWLDLTETADLTVDYVSGQFGPGGEFEGWRFATYSEGQQLLVSAGVVYPAEWHVDNYVPVSNLLDIWGDLRHGYPRMSRGSDFAFDYNPNDWVAGQLGIGGPTYHPGEGWGWAQGHWNIDHDYHDPTAGCALVREVPEPATVALLGLGLFGVFMRRRRQR